MASRVLVTGATGAIAKYCIRALIEAGYDVRGTVRNKSRAPDVVRAAGTAMGDPRVGTVTVDLARDEGWDQAAEGCDAVLHVASPFPLQQPKSRAEIVTPARDGTLRVLAAARRAGCRRVVVTSSIVAVVYPGGPRQSGPFTEADWTDPARSDITDYVVSKTLAEQSAW